VKTTIGVLEPSFGDVVLEPLKLLRAKRADTAYR